MSLYSAMYSGVSGLSAQSTSLGIISQNIANVNTVGYKGSRAEFSSLVTGHWNGGLDASAGGVKATAGSLIRQQGLLQATGSGTDLGISGEGFFIVNSAVSDGEAVGENLFTRAGAFTLDANRNLKNTSGYFLTGWRTDAAGNYVGTNGNTITPNQTSYANLEPINLSGLEFAAQGTTNVSLAANMPANAKVGDTYETPVELFDAVGTSHQSTLTWLKVDTIASTGQLSAAQSPTSVVRSVTDADGNVHDLNLTYTRNAANDWSLTASTADGTVEGGPIALAFDAEGNLTTPADAEISVDWTGDTTDSVLRLDLSGLTQVATGAATVAAELNPAGASWKLSVATDDAADTLTGGASTYVTFNKDGTLAGPSTHTFGIDWADSTTMAADSSITLNFASPNGSGGMGSFGESYSVGSVNQDGIAFGAFSGVSVGNDGLVVALFDNGQSRPVYRIPLARFASPENLAIRDGNAYQMTNASGGMFLSASGENGAGAVTGGTLESSTVDLAGEFTSMITTQRAYSANATIIRTADEMLQELSQLKR